MKKDCSANASNWEEKSKLIQKETMNSAHFACLANLAKKIEKPQIKINNHVNAVDFNKTHINMASYPYITHTHMHTC